MPFDGVHHQPLATQLYLDMMNLMPPERWVRLRRRQHLKGGGVGYCMIGALDEALHARVACYTQRRFWSAKMRCELANALLRIEPWRRSRWMARLFPTSAIMAFNDSTTYPRMMAVVAEAMQASATHETVT